MDTRKRYLVYFFGTDYERVKIGHCKGNLYNRRNHIQNGCPDPIKLLGIILCRDEAEMRKCEISLHEKFREYHTIGEWYRITPEVSAYIEHSTEPGKDILKEDHQIILEYGREYKKRNREQILDRKRKYREENKEKIRVYDREYRQRPEVIERRRKQQRKYRSENHKRSTGEQLKQGGRA